MSRSAALVTTVFLALCWGVFSACDSSGGPFEIGTASAPSVNVTPAPRPAPAGLLIHARGFDTTLHERVVAVLADSSVMRAIDSVRFVETTVDGALVLIEDDMARAFARKNALPPDRKAWLIVASGTLTGIGGVDGRAGTRWVLAAEGGVVMTAVVERSIQVGFPYNGQTIGTGVVPAIDALRVSPDALVRDTNDAVDALVPLLARAQASISDVSHVHSAAGRVATIAGIGSDHVPTKTGGWIFVVNGNLQMQCGGAHHDVRTSLTLLIFEGRSSPYVVAHPSWEIVPALEAQSGLFEADVVEPGTFLQLDEFRASQSEIDARATAFARAAVVVCPEPSEVMPQSP